jgi:DNA repair protein RadC
MYMSKAVAAKTVNSINIYKLKMVREDTVKYGDTEMCSPEVVARLATDLLELHEAAEENFVIICLNTKNKIAGIHTISIGCLNSSIVHPREVFKAALLNNASAIILIHNHPSGDPEPSKEDIETTQRLVNAGNILGIKVLDHVIVGDGRYISLKEQGYMQ